MGARCVDLVGGAWGDDGAAVVRDEGLDLKGFGWEGGGEGKEAAAYEDGGEGELRYGTLQGWGWGTM